MEFNAKPLDCYLAGVSTAGVDSNRLISDIRGARADSDRAAKVEALTEALSRLNAGADALRKRMDAWQGSAKGRTGYVPGNDVGPEDLRFR